MFNDSAYAIPTPMLGHGDVFHHTNHDTPDKCDPTELKRIISLALAASLSIANADDRDALNIAGEVFAHACSRMTDRTSRSIRLLQRCAEDPKKRDSLPEIYSNFCRYPAAHAQIEKANLMEVRELCQDDGSKRLIEEMAKTLDNQARTEYEKINYSHGLFLHRYRIGEKKFRPDEYYQRAAVVIPERRFKGPLPGSILMERAGEEFRDWMEKNAAKIGSYSGPKLYEIVNLMDGNRSLLRIRDIVCCEFSETDIEYVFRFAQEMEKNGLVSFQIRRFP
jgi:hypothetical protein